MVLNDKSCPSALKLNEITQYSLWRAAIINRVARAHNKETLILTNYQKRSTSLQPSAARHCFVPVFPTLDFFFRNSSIT